MWLYHRALSHLTNFSWSCKIYQCVLGHLTNNTCSRELYHMLYHPVPGHLTNLTWSSDLDEHVLKRGFAGGPKLKKMTMPDNTVQLLDIHGKILEHRWFWGKMTLKSRTALFAFCFLTKITLPQHLGLVSEQDELVKRQFHSLTQGTFWSIFKLPLKLYSSVVPLC